MYIGELLYLLCTARPALIGLPGIRGARPKSGFQQPFSRHGMYFRLLT